jgi:uncharacterized protein DUF4390
VLPAPLVPPRRPLARWAALAIVGGLLFAGPSGALELSLSPPRERGGYLYADAGVRDPFGERIAESLQRGMPATLELRAELWRRRGGWFDRLESGFEARVRIQYEAWDDRYRIERTGAAPIWVEGYDSVTTVLSRPWALPVGRIGDLKPGVRYYVVVNAVLKPLSVEDVEEVEGWLSGEVRTQRGAGLGVITELPRSLFDAVRNFAGFGDRRTRAFSRDFTLENLFP